MNNEEMDNAQTSSNSTSQIEPISIDKLREILKQYSESHLKYLEAQKVMEGQRFITMHKMGLIDRGQLAQKLVAIGFPELDVIEILEFEGL